MLLRRTGRFDVVLDVFRELRVHVGRDADQARGVVGTATGAPFGVIVALDVERVELLLELLHEHVELLLELADGEGLRVGLRVGEVELVAAFHGFWAHNLSHHPCAS